MSDIKIKELREKLQLEETDLIVVEDGQDTKKSTIKALKEVFGYDDFKEFLINLINNNQTTNSEIHEELLLSYEDLNEKFETAMTEMNDLKNEIEDIKTNGTDTHITDAELIAILEEIFGQTGISYPPGDGSTSFITIEELNMILEEIFGSSDISYPTPGDGSPSFITLEELNMILEEIFGNINEFPGTGSNPSCNCDEMESVDSIIQKVLDRIGELHSECNDSTYVTDDELKTLIEEVFD